MARHRQQPLTVVAPRTTGARAQSWWTDATTREAFRAALAARAPAMARATEADLVYGPFRSAGMPMGAPGRFKSRGFVP